MKPIEELSAREAQRAHRVVATPVVSDNQHQSWDVDLYSMAGEAPIASNTCTLKGEGSLLRYLDAYAEVMLRRVGLERIEPWAEGHTLGSITARVGVLPTAISQ